MTDPSHTLLKARLDDFAFFRKQHLTGDEKGQAQIFCDRLFQAFGHSGVHEAGATLEFRIRAEARTNFADLMWKPRCLIEMKKSGTDLAKVYRQAFDYWTKAVPDRPRYVVLCNFDEFWIYDFDQQLDAPMDRVKINDLSARSDALAFLLPDPVTPVFQHNLVGVTRDAAADVAHVFTALVERGAERLDAQRFVLQCVMAMFSEDIGLLPGLYFTRAVEDCLDNNADPYDLILGLFREMNTPGRTPGGRFVSTPYFNGGLFASIPPVTLERPEMEALHTAAQTNWSFVRPEIFGTLFEQSMDRGERHATGAHFTSQADIMRVVGPCIVDPWRQRIEAASTIGDLERLQVEMANFRVLDPACGSGNFLYVAYREMRRLEADIRDRIQARRHRSTAEQAALTYVAPDHFLGIDVNPFAVEVAKVTMLLAKKLSADELDDQLEVLPLDSLDDAIVAADALFSGWPDADVIIGNPPYLGRRKMVAELGADYTAALAERHPEVMGVSDFVTYWFPLAHDALPHNGRAGFVATNSVRQNDSREVSLDYIDDHGGLIFEAVSSQPWSGDAAVHVSIVNWVRGSAPQPCILWLNNAQLRLEVSRIPSSLSPDVDLRTAKPLVSNQEPPSCFQGQTPGVSEGFILDRDARADILSKRDNSAMFIYPFLGGREMLNSTEVDRWIIDLPQTDSLIASAAAPAAYQRLQRDVLPTREAAAADEAKRNAAVLAARPTGRPNRHHENFLNSWWRLGYRREEMLARLAPLDRYIATSRVASEERLTVFAFVDVTVRPGDSLSVFSLDDDYSFGILSSGVHRKWFQERCSTLETRLRYTPTTVWDHFPWPQSPTAEAVDAVAQAGSDILDLRAYYSGQGISLRRMYDAMRVPGRSDLRDRHAVLDAAALAAYDFSGEEDLLTQLLALNHTVASLPPDEQQGPGSVRRVASSHRISP